MERSLVATGVIAQLIRKSKRHSGDEYMEYSDIYDAGRVYILQDAENVRIISADRSVDETRKIDDLDI